MQVEQVMELFAALGQVAAATRQVLAAALSHAGRPVSTRDQDVLSATQNHLGQVREGFVVTLRTESARSDAERCDLVRHILVDWSWLTELGLAWDSGIQQLELPVAQVLSFAHATVALGTLPQLPAAQVTFPHIRPTYSDIPVPHSPGEWLARIEELEHVIDSIGARPAAELDRDRLRRTYGYFEASAWLVQLHQQRWKAGR